MNTDDTPKTVRRQPNPIVQAAAAKTRKRRKVITLPTDPTPGQLPLFPVSDLDPEAHR
ncbi:hypothetical protein ACFVJ5_32195 [Nocardia sp. NPDC127606]|uniref:hypothetical protein n=1 Tax=Nocardia sp. NPDC127606 TaxID=3345406 RepID=UPI00363731B0